MLRFDGQVAVITGAGTGLGRSYARLLAARGASVVVNDPGRSVDGRDGSKASADAVVSEIRSAGGNAVANYDSIAEVEGATNVVNLAVGTFGRLDILVNNAGILRDAPLGQSSLVDMHQLIQVHLVGTLLCTRAALPIMLRQNYGRIVLTSSGSGLVGYPGQSIYGAAKAAMLGLMNCVAMECEGSGVTINTVVPSAATRMSQGLVSEDLARLMHPDLVAPLVGWLASRKCERSGECVGAFGGHFAKLQLFKAEGKQFDPLHEVTVEMVAESYAEITDLGIATPFLGTRAVLRESLGKVGRL